MEQLIKQIEQWASDRNIIKGSKPIDQAMKLFSEFGELADSIAKSNLNGIIDGVGDCFVVLTNLCKMHGHSISDHIGSYGKSTNPKKTIIDLSECLYQISESNELEVDLDDYIAPIDMAVSHLDAIALHYDLTLEQCVEYSYNEIKDRVGILWNGTFVKSTDKNYNDVLKMYQDSMEKNYSA